MPGAVDSREDQAGGGSRPAEIARRVRDASSSFYWAMRLLPKARRDAVFAVYAFCRSVDDIADEPGARDHKLDALTAWREEVRRVFAGTPETPTGLALKAAAARYGLAQEDFMAIIDGMAMDADGPVVAPQRQEFDLYLDRVASAVGRLCAPVFGEPGSAGRAVAHHLGRALQITNILRDVAEDARDGRLYLPADLLARHDVPAGEPTGVMASPGFAAAWRELATTAAAEYSSAQAAIARCRSGTMRPARIMMKVYQRNLERMRALDDRALADAAASKRLVGRWEALAIALREALVGR